MRGPCRMDASHLPPRGAEEEKKCVILRVAVCLALIAEFIPEVTGLCSPSDAAAVRGAGIGSCSGSGSGGGGQLRVTAGFFSSQSSSVRLLLICRFLQSSDEASGAAFCVFSASSVLLNINYIDMDNSPVNMKHSFRLISAGSKGVYRPS